MLEVVCIGFELECEVFSGIVCMICFDVVLYGLLLLVLVCFMFGYLVL